MDTQQQQQPVTVVTTRRVRAGREADYERWLSELLRTATTLPGYLGAEVHRPSNGSREYTSVFRFDSIEHLRMFQGSELRRRALADVVDFVEADAIWRETTGLELWFSPPPGTVVAQPVRWRMAIVMVVVVFSLVLSIGRGVAFILTDAPVPLRLLITIVIEVVLMTYVVMPRVTRFLARWIYPKNVTR